MWGNRSDHQRPVLARLATALGSAAFNLVLPPRCLACDVMVANQGGLCSDCWADLRFIADPVCYRTGTPLAYDLGDAIVSADALAHPPPYDRLRAPLCYEGTARALVLALKFHDRLDLVTSMADAMLTAGASLLADADIVIPVPLHRKRLRERRYNQAAELAKAIARRSKKPCALQAVERIKETEQQTTLDFAARLKNVSGAFRVPSDQAMHVHGRHIVLVDDVVTTGATISACTRALLRENAARVDVLTYAKVVKPEEILI